MNRRKFLKLFAASAAVAALPTELLRVHAATTSGGLPRAELSGNVLLLFTNDEAFGEYFVGPCEGNGYINEIRVVDIHTGETLWSRGSLSICKTGDISMDIRVEDSWVAEP